jgi:hypothetical protein
MIEYFGKNMPKITGDNGSSLNSFQAIGVFVHIFTSKKCAIKRKKMKIFTIPKEDEGRF